MERLLHQLTGDLWQVLPEAGARFHDGGRTPLHSHQHAQEVMLFSGGLDSTSYVARRLRLTANRAGACSTRSVHPQTLHLLNALIEGIGGNIRVTNPFEHRTKGEVCAAALEAGLEEAVLWETVSCGHPPKSPRQRHSGQRAGGSPGGRDSRWFRRFSHGRP